VDAVPCPVKLAAAVGIWSGFVELIGMFTIHGFAAEPSPVEHVAPTTTEATAD
jgi:hypothetical protein